MRSSIIKSIAMIASTGTVYLLPNLGSEGLLLRPPVAIAMGGSMLVWLTQVDLHRVSETIAPSERSSLVTVGLAVLLAQLLPVLEWSRNGSRVVPLSDPLLWLGVSLLVGGLTARGRAAFRSRRARFPLCAERRSAGALVASPDSLGSLAVVAGHALLFRAPVACALGVALLILAYLQRSRIGVTHADVPEARRAPRFSEPMTTSMDDPHA